MPGCPAALKAIMNATKRGEFYKRLSQKNPNPTTELNYNSHFQLMVAVILSAQATDISVNKATKELFRVAGTPRAMLGLGENRLKKYIKNIGLFNNKAKNIIKACRCLVEQHKEVVPENRSSLEALPGVGRKTANVILNTAFAQPTIAVDTHIFRVSNRTGLAPGKNVIDVEKKLKKVTPKEFQMNAHHWLILHGRYVCKARNPSCGKCFLEDLCKYKNKTIQNKP